MSVVRGQLMSTAQEQRFTEIYVTHYADVLGYLLRRMSRVDAEDAASDVLTVVWRRLNEVPYGIETLPWLYGVALRGLSDQRRAKRRRNLLSRFGTFVARSGETGELIGVGGDAEDSLVGALNTLKVRDREILLLNAWEELTASEIAMLFKISSAAAEKRLTRAKNRLATALLSGASRTATTRSSESTEGSRA